MTTPSTTRKNYLFILIAIACLAALFGLWSRHNLHSQDDKVGLKTATVFTQPRAVTPFQLTDDHGKPFTLDNLKGHFSLIFFGFTHCPDLCPTTLAMLNQTYKILEQAHLKSLPQVIFISVDPERDSLSAIKTYLSSFNSAFLGATGNKAQLDKLTQEMSVLYTKVAQPGAGGENYTIDHSGTIILTNPQGQFYGVFTMPHDSQKIADDMRRLLTPAA